MKNYYVCTANDGSDIVAIDAVFEEESKAVEHCSSMNHSKHGLFLTYTYSVLNVRKEEVSSYEN